MSFPSGEGGVQHEQGIPDERVPIDRAGRTGRQLRGAGHGRSATQHGGVARGLGALRLAHSRPAGHAVPRSRVGTRGHRTRARVRAASCRGDSRTRPQPFLRRPEDHARAGQLRRAVGRSGGQGRESPDAGRGVRPGDDARVAFHGATATRPSSASRMDCPRHAIPPTGRPGSPIAMARSRSAATWPRTRAAVRSSMW